MTWLDAKVLKNFNPRIKIKNIYFIFGFESFELLTLLKKNVFNTYLNV